jgi:hypothetical protein
MNTVFALVDHRQQIIAEWPFSMYSEFNKTVPVERKVVSEKGKYSFLIKEAPSDCDFEISIGDMSTDQLGLNTNQGQLNEFSYRRFKNDIYWVEGVYFESARGVTPISVRVHFAGELSWREFGLYFVYVQPTKLGETRYESMANDLHALSAGLLLDLLGKSKRNYEKVVSRLGISYRSKESELKAIEILWDRLSPVLHRISDSPCVRTIPHMISSRFWEAEPICNKTLKYLMVHGISMGELHQGLRVKAPVLKPRTDINIAEHQILLAFLLFLKRRLMDCRRAISKHIEAIESDRRYREISIANGPSLYQTVDCPRLDRLRGSSRQAEHLQSLIFSAIQLPMFQGVNPRMVSPRAHEFQQSNLYRATRIYMSQYLTEASIWMGDGIGDATLKLTSRMYEQWVFIRLVDAFRRCNINLEPWHEVIRNSIDNRFTIDVDRGLTFCGNISISKQLRITYEPWVVSEAEAKLKGSGVCRGGEVTAPWCPDILIECLESSGDKSHVVYAIVVDCKYTMQRMSYHLDSVRKYLQIRATDTGRQIVHQVWVALPSEPSGITCDDPNIIFTDNGPSCQHSDTFTGQLSLVPDKLICDYDMFTQFAEGTLAYLRLYT